MNTGRCPITLTQLTSFWSDPHVVALNFPILSPSWLRAPSCSETHNLLTYLMTQPDVAAEAGADHDKANRVSRRGCGSSPEPCWLKQQDENVLYTITSLIKNNGKNIRKLGRVI